VAEEYPESLLMKNLYFIPFTTQHDLLGLALQVDANSLAVTDIHTLEEVIEEAHFDQHLAFARRYPLHQALLPEINLNPNRKLDQAREHNLPPMERDFAEALVDRCAFVSLGPTDTEEGWSRCLLEGQEHAVPFLWKYY
jgi:hypothetical protein